MGVEARGNEGPDLVENHGQGQQKCRHEQDFDGHHERRDDRGGNQGCTCRQIGHQGGGKQVVKLCRPREYGQNGGCNADTRHGAYQPVAQLH